MADNRPNAQNTPRRDIRGLWLLPLLALGVGILLVTRKKLPLPYQPTKAEVSQMARHEAFRNAKYLVGNQIIHNHPKSVIINGFGPETDSAVTELGRDRFRCSGLLTARSPAGVPLSERWQCILTGSQTSWTCESLQQSGWKRVLTSPASGEAVGTGKDRASRRK